MESEGEAVNGDDYFNTAFARVIYDIDPNVANYIAYADDATLVGSSSSLDSPAGLSTPPADDEAYDAGSESQVSVDEEDDEDDEDDEATDEHEQTNDAAIADEPSHESTHFKIRDSPNMCGSLHTYLLTTVDSPFPLDIRLSPIENAGFGVFTLKELPPGFEVFRVIKPLVTAASDPDMVCDNCFLAPDLDIRPAGMAPDPPPVLHRCARCQCVKYCSKECQIAAWADHHSQECKHIDRARKRGGMKLRGGELAVDMIFSRILHKLAQGTFTDEERKALGNLISHHKRSLVGGLIDTNHTFWDTRAMTGGMGELPDMSVMEMFELYAKIEINAITIRHPISPGSGISVDPFVSMINHSCDPNIMFFFEGSQARFRTTRAIANGEELFIAYSEPTYEVNWRARDLHGTYNFLCGCPRCEREKNVQNGTPGYSALVKKVYLEIQEELASSISDIALSGSPEETEDTMRSIVIHALRVADLPCDLLPGDRWPEHLQPMIDIRTFIASVNQDFDDEYALKMLLKLCFVSFPAAYGGRTGTDWVKAFYLLVSTLRKYIEGLRPEITDWSLVRNVYVRKLADDAADCYGGDTGFVSVLMEHLRTERRTLTYGAARSRAFVDKFLINQQQLFTWAGIPDAVGVSLVHNGRDAI
ncbi:hypothetical protein AAFC00_005695 [Neodothiora populina]|uniref:MYND-type zinc finger protein samB n=1 Tax=Neodothiora populina TaxID=2781224 RepID=A0ABR3P5I5_9PEZI